MKRIDTEKADKLKNMDREQKAQAILSRVQGDESRLKSSDLKDLIAWKTGKPCPSSISTVESRRAKWNSIKDSECQWQPWTPKDEEERTKLCSLIDSLPIEATRLQREREASIQSFHAIVACMNPQQREEQRNMI